MDGERVGPHHGRRIVIVIDGREEGGGTELMRRAENVEAGHVVKRRGIERRGCTQHDEATLGLGKCECHIITVGGDEHRKLIRGDCHGWNRRVIDLKEQRTRPQAMDGARDRKDRGVVKSDMGRRHARTGEKLIEPCRHGTKGPLRISAEGRLNLDNRGGKIIERLAVQSRIAIRGRSQGIAPALFVSIAPG